MPLTIELFWESGHARLPSDEPIVVPEGRIGVRIDYTVERILFDDEPLVLVPSSDGHSGFAQLDLTNRIGFHRISRERGARQSSVDFETSTAKATAAEITAMANQLAEHAFSYRHQFHYSLPNGVRRMAPLPAVEFGWYRDRLPEIAALVGDIARRAGTSSHTIVETTFRGRRPAVSETFRYLRANPERLEPHDEGQLLVEGRRFSPSSIRARVRLQEPARFEHEQLAYFLRLLSVSLSRLLSEVPGSSGPTVERWRETVAALRAYPVVRRHDLPGRRAPWSPVPTMLQKTDHRYGRLRVLLSEYARDIMPTTDAADATRVNVRDVWEIYQAFCAITVGHALGLRFVSRREDLRDRDTQGRSMASSEVDLYYDRRPPFNVLPSWRDNTTRPGEERPDIVLVDRRTNAVAVLDVKFRAAGNHAPGEDLQEMQSYLNSFGIAAGGVIFPGIGAPEYLSASGRTLAEIPMRAAAPSVLLRERVREAVATLWTIPSL